MLLLRSLSCQTLVPRISVCSPSHNCSMSCPWGHGRAGLGHGREPRLRFVLLWSRVAEFRVLGLGGMAWWWDNIRCTIAFFWLFSLHEDCGEINVGFELWFRCGVVELWSVERRGACALQLWLWCLRNEGLEVIDCNGVGRPECLWVVVAWWCSSGVSAVGLFCAE